MKPDSISEEDHYIELSGLSHFAETLKVARYYQLHPSHPPHTFAMTLDSMRKLYVSITILDPSDVDDTLPAIGRCITLLKNIGENPSLARQNFGLLRKVRELNFTGAHPEYGEHLTIRMSESAPVDMSLDVEST
ncbi:hypothetical protein SUNI508_03161 [Seiridium unicorne]|uniref:Uncharacterized protein n=1 Tax=Seiridium unicorne TaxID=138068 RepID=A0ABR2VER1_9PEZI